MGPDLISSFYEHGIAPTAALICTSFYIQLLVTTKTRDKATEINDKTYSDRYNKEIELLNKLVDNQAVLLDQLRTLTANTVTLAELSRNISNENHNVMGLANSLITDVKILASNQLTMMSGFQKVIEQLIFALRD